MGGVDLDAVAAGRLDACGGVGEVGHDDGQLLDGGLGVGRHLAAGQRRHAKQLVHRGVGHHPSGVRRRWRDRGDQGRPALGHVDAGGLAVVAGLDDQPGPVGVDGLGQPAQAGDHAVVGERRLVAGGRPARVGDRRGLDDQEAGAAPGPGLVVGDGLVGDEALLGAVVLVHRRQDDAVSHLHRPDSSWREELRERLGHAAIMPDGPSGRPLRRVVCGRPPTGTRPGQASFLRLFRRQSSVVSTALKVKQWMPAMSSSSATLARGATSLFGL